MGSLSLLQWIFPTQESNWGLLHCRWILHQLSYQGSPKCEVKVKAAQSCPTLCDPMDYTVHGIFQARMLEWIDLPFSKGSSQPRNRTRGLPHCRWILYQLSHKGNPRILEWIAYPFSGGSSQPRNQTGVLCITGIFFTNRAIREDLSEMEILGLFYIR